MKKVVSQKDSQKFKVTFFEIVFLRFNSQKWLVKML
jgi:hypothetical protein